MGTPIGNPDWGPPWVTSLGDLECRQGGPHMTDRLWGPLSGTQICAPSGRPSLGKTIWDTPLVETPGGTPIGGLRFGVILWKPPLRTPIGEPVVGRPMDDQFADLIFGPLLWNPPVVGTRLGALLWTPLNPPLFQTLGGTPCEQPLVTT
jgi:hypothetical protein